MQWQFWIDCTESVRYVAARFMFMIKCRVRPNILGKGKGKKLIIYSGKVLIFTYRTKVTASGTMQPEKSKKPSVENWAVSLSIKKSTVCFLSRY